ncbi:hypothetical protein IFR09_11275 [Pseudomonas syringae]|nr:hypothetical protein [Pseudomonas syringae]MBD8790959.1 hypothetical protein [Pseudomonas syringae]MBD8801904.1 hypothetical protein [Pseudomonas syringae]MBD8811746.1 hypothetical protein [Pseudomonas syringae]
MKAKALKTFLHDELGRVEKGQEFEATEAQLAPVLDFVEVIDDKKKKAT